MALLHLPANGPTEARSAKGNRMAKTPNYDFERKERERQKALKKQEKLAAKAAAKEKSKPAEEAASESAKDDRRPS